MSLSYPEAWIFSPRFLSFYPNYNKSDITEVYLRTRSQVDVNTDECALTLWMFVDQHRPSKGLQSCVKAATVH